MRYMFTAETCIVIGENAASPVLKAATYLQTQVEQRTGWRWQIRREMADMDTGAVILGVPGDGTAASPFTPTHTEEIALWCSGDGDAPRVYALAGSPSVALAVVGKLARAMELRPGIARVPPFSIQEHPAYPVRGKTFANHKQNNTYDKWEWHHWEEYLTELAAWGNNIAMLYPLRGARWERALPFADPPWFDDPRRAEEWRRQWEIQTRLPGLCGELGMRYGIWLPVNEVFLEETVRHPEITKNGGAYACPHTPGGRERMRAYRETLFAALPHLDVLMLPTRDDGGCPGCDECTPWAQTYLELAQEQIAQARRYHPSCTVWLSLQGLAPDEAQLVLDWLDRERPEWVEAIAFGPYSELMNYGERTGTGDVLALTLYTYGGPIAGPVQRLRAAVPGQYGVVLYPDTTHTFRSQYAVVGMDPAVQHVWDRENGPCPRPREFAAIHALTSPPSEGSAAYSEGSTDDVNKFLWAALDWTPGKTAEQVITDYTRWFFGADHADNGAALIFAIEEALNAPLYGSAAVQEAKRLVQHCEQRDPALVDNWRWLLIRLAALMLDHMQQTVMRDRELAASLRYRVPGGSNFDPSMYLRDGIRYVTQRFAETEGLLRDIIWTRDALFAKQRLAVRGVANLQNSYMGLDRLVERWREVIAELERGGLVDHQARRATLTAAMSGFEESARAATRGIGLVEHLREYEWEEGPVTWPRA